MARKKISETEQSEVLDEEVAEVDLDLEKLGHLHIAHIERTRREASHDVPMPPKPEPLD